MPSRFAHAGRFGGDARAGQSPAPQAPPLALCWLPGDRIRFQRSSGTARGVVTSCNRSTVDVQVRQGDVWRVSRTDLHPDDAQTRRITELRQERLGEIEAEAMRALDRHGLEGWNFRLDAPARRSGMCDYRKRLISISVGYALVADAEEVSRTILHEIAHGLVGPKHRHGPVWRKMAQSIGSTEAVTHNIAFSPPRWEGSCPCGAVRIGRIRRSRLRCHRCGQELAWTRIDGIAEEDCAGRSEGARQ